MARSLRIEYENAWYHIMDRGARKMAVFNEDSERYLFLDLLNQIHDKYKVEIHAYCLMDNHYHLLIKTPWANLSKSMQHLNGMYVQRYNKMYKTDGPLFRGRFKSIIIDADNYLLRLSRYIHLNPVKSKLTDKAWNYKWSSCNAYLDDSKKTEWIQTNEVLSKFGDTLQRQKYRLFLEEGNDGELETFFNKVTRLPILGAEAFITTITKKYLSNKTLSLEVPEQNFLYKKQLVTVDDLMLIIAQYYQVNIEKLKTSTRGTFNKPRSVAIYLAAQMTGQSLRAISEAFTNITYSGVSRIVSTITINMMQDITLKEEINKIRRLLINSQLKI
jgi:putative transposase